MEVVKEMFRLGWRVRRSILFTALVLFFTGWAIAAAMVGQWMTSIVGLQGALIVSLVHMAIISHLRLSRLERRQLEIPSIQLEVVNRSMLTEPFTASFVGTERLKN